MTTCPKCGYQCSDSPCAKCGEYITFASSTGSVLGIECPWPESVWPMTEKQYVKAVPDPVLRTAISGFLMRRGWEVAVKQMQEAQNAEVSHE